MGYAHLKQGERHVEILVAGEERQNANVVCVATTKMVGEMGSGAVNGARDNWRIRINSSTRTDCNGCSETMGRGITPPMSRRRTTSKETRDMSEARETLKPADVAGRLDGLVGRQRDKTATEITKALLKKRIVIHCHDCGHEIYRYDDDAWVCIQCCGRSRRMPHNVLLTGAP